MLVSIQNILDRKGVEVFTIAPTATVRTAAQLMQAHGIAALIVKSADVIGGPIPVAFLLSFLLFRDLIEELLRCHVLFGSLTPRTITGG